MTAQHTARRRQHVVHRAVRARDWVAMPSAIFTDPEVATVGLSEEEAKKAAER